MQNGFACSARAFAFISNIWWWWWAILSSHLLIDTLADMGEVPIQGAWARREDSYSAQVLALKLGHHSYMEHIPGTH